jgi:putative ABC transport system substrate-binding protein
MEWFRQSLRESGYLGDQNLTIELRYARGGGNGLSELVADLIQLRVDVIATFGDVVTRVVQQTTTTVPIVALSDDLLEAGLVASLVRSGVNTTGVTMVAPELSAKRLALLSRWTAEASSLAP